MPQARLIPTGTLILKKEKYAYEIAMLSVCSLKAGILEPEETSVC
jgi:hypothetical protein